MSPELLQTRAEARARRIAWAGSVGTLILSLMLAVLLRRAGLSLVYSAPIALILAWISYQWLMAPTRRRRKILSQPFPAEWEAVLQKDVVFYRALEPEGQARFRRELQVFIGEKRITGIKTDIDVTTRVLAGASAIIPIFGFPQWEWDQISEVLIYPGRFGPDFGFEQGQNRNTLGMVGTGPMNRIMILSKPDLIHGFRNPADKRNVGLHEFAHLVDKSDGTIDGVPALGLDRETIGPWVELMRRKMEEIEDGDSDIDRYALTNEAEFFAVTTEYLFERPGLMQRKHPELFAMMQKIFEQDLASRVGDLSRVRKSGPRRFGRNSPCPCGSGKKYKKCCLGKG